MELKELNDAIKELERHHCYPLSDSEQPNGYILEYNAEDRVWEYYYFDEKDGKRDLKTFVTEDEACKYVLKRAMEYVENSMKPIIDKLRREYLNEDNSVLSDSCRQVSLYNILCAIDNLKYYQNDYLKELGRNEVSRVYGSEYNTNKEEWEYGLFSIGEKTLSYKVFFKEEEACQYIIDKAVEILQDFGEAWKEMVVEKDKRIADRMAEHPERHKKLVDFWNRYFKNNQIKL